MIELEVGVLQHHFFDQLRFGRRGEALHTRVHLAARQGLLKLIFVVLQIN